MTTSILDKIHQERAKKGLTPNTDAGRVWLLRKMQSLRPTSTSILADRTALRNRTILGRFYFFLYDAKLKETLPYWDKFPLVIPIQRYHDGFLGLNLHYLPMKDRLILLKKLNQFSTGSLGDERTRLQVTYPILQAAHRIYEATPCIKRYLFPQIQSRFLEIPPHEWDIAAALPVQQFSGASSQMVWKESKERY